MSLGTAVVALGVLFGARRLLPAEDRHHGRAFTVFLSVGVLLGILRLVFAAAGASASIGGVLLSVVTTFCVTMGAVGTGIQVLLEILPGLLGLRFPSLVRDVIQAAAFVLIAFGALKQSGLDLLPLVTTAGVATAVIGLALQNTIANVFAGLMLYMDRALGVGDWIQVATRTGQIAQIRWRSTLLRNTDGDVIIVPNSQMLGAEVYNFSRPQLRHRVWIHVGFHYRHAPNDVREILIDAARGAPGVLSHPAPDSFPTKFGDSSVDYALRFWIDEIGRQRDIEGEVFSRIWYAARRANLEIPFPIRTVHLHQPDDKFTKATDANDQLERLALLGRVDLFKSLEHHEREALAASMIPVAFARGEAIIRQGAAGDNAYLIARGDVRVWLQAGDVTQEVATLGPGTLIGEMTLMTGDARTATCTAVSDVACFVIDHAGFQRVLNLRPQIADDMSLQLSTRQAQLAEKGGQLTAKAAAAMTENRQNLVMRMRSFFGLQ